MGNPAMVEDIKENKTKPTELSVSVVRLRFENLARKTRALAEWFRNETGSPPDDIKVSESTHLLDDLVRELAKNILSVEAVPAALWKPFWKDHYLRTPEKSREWFADYWNEAAIAAEETLAFLDELEKYEDARKTNQQSAHSISAKNTLDSQVKQDKSDEGNDKPHTIWLKMAFKAFCLWIGDPKTRIPKILILAGLPMVTSPWWLPIVYGLFSTWLGLDQALFDSVELYSMISGWCLVLVGIGLYIRATPRSSRH